MKNMKYGLILGLSLAFVLPAWAETEGDFSFDVADEAATITGYSGSDAVLAIPSTLGGYPVVAIASQAFLETANLTDVLFPDSLLSIGDTAFAGCTALTNVQFGPQLLSIGGSAFASTSIREIVIPDSVTNIGYSAVTPCLEQLVIGDGMTELCCQKFGTNLQNVVIGDGVTNITSGAFQSCAQLTNIVFGANVQDIDSGAFSGCTSLTDFVAPPTLKILKNGPFGGCTSLTNIVLNEGLENMDGSVLCGVPIREIYIPSTVTNLGNNPFSGCTALERVDLSAATNIQAIPSSAFSGCSSLSTVEFPVGGALTVIGDSAFSGTAIREIVIPDSVTNIGYSAVTPCLEQLFIGDGITELCCMKFGTNLQNVVIGDGVTNITSGAFEFCPQLTNIVFGANVQHIGESAFTDCTALTDLVFPPSVAQVVNSAFSGCTGLTAVTLPDTVTTLSGSAFSGCTGLRTFDTGNGVTNLGSVFGGCTNLTSVRVGSGVRVIESGAFSGMANLQEVYLAEGVEIIHQSAFQGTGITALTLPDSVVEVSENAFGGCSNLTEIVWGSGVRQVINGAFSGCVALTNVTLPDHVTSLSGGAFSGCTGLLSVEIGNGVTNDLAGVFSGASNLQSIVLGDAMTAVGGGAFSGCINLENVVFGTNIQSIGSGAFYNTGLTSLEIPDLVTNVENGAFGGCSNLTSLVIGDGLTELCCMKFGTNLQNVVISDSVTNITSGAFQSCHQLTNVVFGANVQHIGESAFTDCTALTDIELPASVERLDNSAFSNCSALMNVDFSLATNLTMIAYGAFGGCSALTDVEMPANLQTLTGSPFSGCTSLTNIVLNDGLIEIGDYALGSLPLTSISIPSSIQSLSASALNGCTNLTSIEVDAATVPSGAFCGLYALESLTFGPNVVEIGSGICGGCYALEEVVIPDQVTAIGSGMFGGCTNISRIVIGDGVTNIPSGAFSGGLCNLTEVVLGENVQDIGGGAFYGATSLATVTIPASVTNLNAAAFSGCSSLQDIQFEGEPLLVLDAENGLILSPDGTVVESFLGGRDAVVIPEGVKEIAAGLFAYRSDIVSISLPDSLETFTGDMFAGCENLAEVRIGQAIQTAIQEVPDGVAVGVRAGTYGPILMPTNRTVRLVSVDGPEAAVIDGGGTNICVEIEGYSAYLAAWSSGDYETREQIGASLEGIMWGGAPRSVLDGFRLQHGSTGAIGVDLERCRVTECGVGTYYANLSHCVLDRNDWPAESGNVYFSTIVSNRNLPNLSYVGYSILWGQEVRDYSQCSLVQCWTDGMGDPMFVDVAAGNYRLQDGSPCVDGLMPWSGVEAETDFDGQPRLAGTACDFGAFELPVPEGCWRAKALTEGHASSINPAGSVTVQDGGSATFTAERGVAPFLGWRIGDEIVSTNRTYTLENIQTNCLLVAVFGPAIYWVDASASTDGIGLEEEPMRDLQAALDASWPGDMVKVRPGRYAPVAATNQAIVVEAVEGPDVTFIDATGTGTRCAQLIASNSYPNYNFGWGDSNDWGHATLDSTNVVMRGFTFCGMDCLWAESSLYGPTCAVWGGTLENCRVVGNAVRDPDGVSYGYGVGAYYARLKNCLVASNRFVRGGSIYGVGLAYCIADGCEIVGNVGESAGDGASISGVGACFSSLSNCVVRGNCARALTGGTLGAGLFECCLVDGRVEDNVAEAGGYGYGGGTTYSYLLRCSVRGNRFEGGGSYFEGAGVNGGQAINCVIAYNTGATDGGGSYSAQLQNCLVVGNEALIHTTYYYGQGGGVCGGEANNCAILNNKAFCSAGGAYRADLRNCIVWGNTVAGPYYSDGVTSPKDHQVYQFGYWGGTNLLENCVVEGGTNGVVWAGSQRSIVLEENPLFVWDVDHPENCRFLAGSPCVDAGVAVAQTNEDASCDLLGNARIQGGATDIGPVEMAPGYANGLCSVVVDAGGGVVSGTGANGLLELTNGGSCTLTATTDESVRPFLGWMVNGVDFGTNRDLTLTGLSGVTKVEARYGSGHIWVEATADDELADGSAAHPFADLQTALDVAVDGDVIHVKAGIYDGVQTWAKKVRVVGEDGAERSIIDPDWKNPCVFVSSRYYEPVLCTNTVFENMTLRHGCATNATYYGMGAGAANMGGIFRHCIIEDCGVHGHSGVWNNDDESLCLGCYEGCVIRNFENLYFYTFSGMQVRDCLFEGNIWSSSLYAGTDEFVNCTFVRNRFVDTTSYSYYFRNCIFWGNEGTLSFTDSSDETLELHSCIQGYTGTVSTIWTEDPQFVDFENGDYRLSPTSPYINAGVQDVVTTETDAAGQPRVQNKWVDLGAYEGTAVEGEHFVMTHVDGDGAVSAWRIPIQDGGTVTIEALPVDAYHPLGYWEVDGVKAGTNTTLVLSDVTDDHFVRAFYPDMEFWVDAGVRQSGAGTSNSPLKTIEEAAAITLDGDTVMVRAGVYAPISVTNGSIRILGADGAENCIIDGGGTNRCALLGEDVVLEEFTLRNGCATNAADQYDRSGGGVRGGTLYYCILTNNVGQNGGGSYESALYGCYVLGNRALNSGGGITMTYSRRVENCIVVGNTAGVAGGIDQGYASECNLVGCTIIGNTATNHTGGLWAEDSNEIVRNCIIWGNSAVRSNQNVGVNSWSDWVRYGYTNILINCCVPDFRYGTGLVQSEPEFVRVGNGVRDNYRLMEGSPLIDAGLAGTNDWSRDAAGHARVVGEAPDIGAYEGSFESVRVTFVVDESKCWTGAAQGMLVQNVQAGLDAVLPDVRPYQGWEMHWEGDWHAVTEDRTITAVYEAVPTDWPVVVHQGNLTNDETWAAGVVHVVCGRIETDGFLLTIEAGAVVKFEPMASLIGGVFTPIHADGAIFTHLFDDDHGGDTLQDGTSTVPTFGEYGIENLSGSNIEVLFGSATTVSTIGDIIPGHVMVVEQSLTVYPGQTLVLTPGTILKFKPGMSLTVNGTLIAQGTPGNPVIFTSFRDDEHGGDTDGDGGAALPQPGDWHQITGEGTVSMEYGQVLWCSAENNQGGLYPRGGKWTFDNSIIAHCEYDCMRITRGVFSAKNSIFMDASMGAAPSAGQATFVNCVFHDLTTAVRWGNGSFVNCVFSEIANDIIDTKFYSSTLMSSFSHCIFWAPNATGDRAGAKVGYNGNIWANPMFYNAPDDDFRLLEGSPAIDMGDGFSAPACDAWGQPRVTIPAANGTGLPSANGGIPDVGIYEYPARYGDAGNVDLVAESVSVEPSEAAVGDEVSICVRVVNQGSEDWKGMWLDRLELTDEYGLRTYPLIEKMTEARIGAGQPRSIVFNAKIPAMPEGDWRVKVSLNVDRGIFEGQAVSNNVATFTNTLHVAVPAVPADGGAFEVKACGETLVRLLGVPSDGGLLGLEASGIGDMQILGTSGDVPTEARTWPVLAGAGEAWMPMSSVPVPDATYLLVKNPGAAETVTLSLGALETRVTGVSPTTLARSTPAVLSMTGLGLKGMTSAELWKDETVVATATEVAAESDTKAAATFALADVEPGTYSVKVQVAGEAYDVPGTVEVAAVRVGAKLKAWLEMPASVRDGRVFTGYVCYQNVGDADMVAPLFSVSGRESTTKVSATLATGLQANRAYVIGASPTEPRNILKAGEKGRAAFYFSSQGQYHIDLQHVLSGQGADPEAYVNAWWAREQEKVATAEAKAESSALDAILFQEVYEENERVAAALMVVQHSIAGVLLDETTGLPLSDEALVVKNAAGYPVEEVKTGVDGAFVTSRLPREGTYSISGLTCPVQGGEAIDVNGPITGVQLIGTALGRVCGFVRDDGGSLLDGVSVRAVDDQGEKAISVTDEDGFFDIRGLENGSWQVMAQADAEHVASMPTEVTFDATNRTATVDFVVGKGSIVNGFVYKQGEQEGLADASLYLLDGAGNIVVGTRTAENGAYAFPMVLPGTYEVRLNANPWILAEASSVSVGVDNVTLDLVAKMRPLFDPFPAVGFAPLTTHFGLLVSDKALSATAFAWDFDGDGITDSTDAIPEWTFPEPGRYGVTLRMTLEDGTVETETIETCVEVMERVPTVYQEDVVVLVEDEAANRDEYVPVRFSDGVLVLEQLEEVPSQPMTVGTKIIFVAPEDGTGHRVQVTDAIQEGTMWTLSTTEDGLTLKDFFVSFSWSILDDSSTPEPSLSARAVDRHAKTLPSALSAIWNERLGRLPRRDAGGEGGDGTSAEESLKNQYEYGIPIASVTFEKSYNAKGLSVSAFALGNINAGMKLEQDGSVEERYFQLTHSEFLNVDAQFGAEAELANFKKEFSPAELRKETVVNGWKIVFQPSFSFDWSGCAGVEGHYSRKWNGGGTVSLGKSQPEAVSTSNGTDKDGGSKMSAWANDAGSISLKLTWDISRQVNDGIFTQGKIYISTGYDWTDKWTRSKGSSSFNHSGDLTLAAGVIWNFNVTAGQENDLGADQTTTASGANMRSNEESDNLLDIYAGKEMFALFGNALDKIPDVFDDNFVKKLKAMSSESVVKSLFEYGKASVEGYVDVRVDEVLRAIQEKKEGIDKVLHYSASQKQRLEELLEHGIDAERMRGVVYYKNAELLKKIYSDAKDWAEIVSPKNYVELSADKFTAFALSQAEQAVALAENMLERNRNIFLTLTDDLPGEQFISQAQLQIGAMTKDLNVDALRNAGEQLSFDEFEAGNYLVSYVATYAGEAGELAAVPAFSILQVRDPFIGNEIPAIFNYALVDGFGTTANATDANGFPALKKLLMGLNPLLADSDGDGMRDKWELSYGLNVRADDANDDADGDGVSNLEEYKGGGEEAPQPESRRMTSRGNGDNAPAESPKATNPREPDTDGGGVSDMDELLFGLNPRDRSDDNSLCKTCAVEGEEYHGCTCLEKFGNNAPVKYVNGQLHCECGGCPECQPLDDSDNGSPVQSCDPNEIVGPAGFGDVETERYVAPGTELEYYIYFENKADAAAAAQEVWVTLPLDANMDWSTFEAGVVMANNTMDIGLSGVQSGTSQVSMATTAFDMRSSVALDLVNGVATWYLRVVDTNTFDEWPEDPYAGFLPPNTTNYCGEGYVTFKVRAREDLALGDRIAACAEIVFDYNDPIVTDPSWWNLVATNVTVSFGEEGALGEKECILGQELGELPEAEGPEGYLFGGWWTEPDGHGRQVDETTVVGDGMQHLYPLWTLNGSRVTLDANGGTGGTESVTAIFGQAMPVAAAPALSKYTFLGYFDATNGGTQYYDGAMQGVTNWDRVDPEVTLYAQWRGNPTVITLNANGGKAGTAKVTAYYGEAMPAVAKAPYRTGYILLGIYSAKSGGTQYWDGDMQSKRAWNQSKASCTLYAHWKKSTTTKVTFNANGGKLGTKSTTATYGAPMPDATGATRTGYTFLGYYTKKSGGVRYYDGKMKSLRKWSSKAKTYTLYAHWSAKKSTVTIQAHGGTPETITATATYGKAMPKITAPTRKGYNLVGVYNKTSAGTKYWTAAGTSARSWNLTGSAYTFHARWKLKTAAITLNRNGGTGGSAKVTATYGKAMPAATAPKRSGYKFLGYYSAKTGGTQYYDAKMASVRKWSSAASKYTLYAQWVRISTITLNANGGSNGTAKVTATYGKAMPKATAPVRKGYTFLGIYNAKTGGTQYYDESMGSVRNWNGTGTAYTFYAHWARNATITIDANGGSNGTEKVTAVVGKPMPAATAPVREGYDFLGIFNKRAGGTAYWTSEMASVRDWNGTGSSYTFYAQWTLSGLDPETGVAVYNGPLAEAEPDVDGGWSVVDGDETTAWTGEAGAGEWHLLLGFETAKSVGGVEVVGEDLPEEGATFLVSPDGGSADLEAWDGATPATFYELLLNFIATNGIPPTVREIYFAPPPSEP